MKVLIDKNNLINGVNIVSKAIPTKSTMPILRCILLDAATEKIRLIANDTELGIETGIEGQISDHGIIAIEANMFSNIIRKLPDGLVTIETNGERVEIRCQQAVFRIMGMNGDDFVYLPEVDKDYGIEVSEYSLREIINRTIFSAATNDANQIMTGELFEIHGNTLRVAALDGHRIAVRRIELKDNYSNRRVILPGKTVQEISKILGDSTESIVSIYFTDKQAMFAFGTTVVVSRLIEGNYYNIDQMLSLDYKTHLKINRQEFLSCLDRATLLIKEENKKPIILVISDEEMELKITTELGSMDERIPIEKDGNDLKIGFNPRFLIDALRAIDEEEPDIYLQSLRAPLFIRDEGTYCYLILPVNFVDV